MSITVPKPATTPIPVQLSEPEFDAFILPHLSMPKRGPKCKLGYYSVFNLILRILYKGSGHFRAYAEHGMRREDSMCSPQAERPVLLLAAHVGLHIELA